MGCETHSDSSALGCQTQNPAKIGAWPTKRVTGRDSPPSGARTRARIVEEAAALIHERGVAGTTLEDVKVAAEVSGSAGCTTTSPDKNELVQAVIDYQADTHRSLTQRHALGSANGVEAWPEHGDHRSEAHQKQGGLPPRFSRWSTRRERPLRGPKRSSRQGSIGGQPPSAMHSDPFMPTGNSRPASTRTTSPLLCSPRSQGGLLLLPRCIGVPARFS